MRGTVLSDFLSDVLDTKGEGVGGVSPSHGGDVFGWRWGTKTAFLVGYKA